MTGPDLRPRPSAPCPAALRSPSRGTAQPPVRLLALLLIGAVGCGSSHHHKSDAGDDDGGSETEDGHDASADTGTPVNRPDAGKDSGGGGNTDLDAGDGGGSTITLPDGAMVPNDGGPGGGGGGDGGDAGAGDAGGGGGNGVISTSAVSFGLSPCGGAAPGAQTITLTNSTGSALTYTATLSATTAFALTGATNSVLTGTVAAGANGTLTVTATGVAATATAGQAITASLDITTNLAAPNDHLTVPVSIVPQGATLIVVPSTTPNASFGVVPFNGTPSTLPIKLQNAGNVAAVVTVTQPTVTQFTLLSGGTAATSITVPAATGENAGSVDLTASFAPTLVGPLASSAGLTIAGAVCGASSAKQVSFDGTGSGAGFVASATTPLPAFVDCGATGAALPAATISVGNFTASALTFTAGMLSGAGSPFILSATSATVDSSASANVNVSLVASAVPKTATPGTVISDTVVLTPPTGLGLSPIQLPVTTTVRGAVLTFGTATPFNSATNAAPQPQLITVNNVGNVPVSPTISTTGGDAALFTITGALTPAAVPVGSSASPGQSGVTVSFTPPVGDATPKTAQLVITPGASDVLCSASAPAPLTLTGTATTPGFHLDTPSDGTLLFGNAGFVDCPAGNLGITPVALTAAGLHRVRFTNTGSSTLNWTAALAQGTNLFQADALTGSLAAGQQAIITLTPQPIPYPANTATDAYSDVLTITTDIVNDGAHTVNLKQTAQGAVVTASATSADFGLVHNGLTSALNPAYTFQNAGNGGTNLTVTPTVTANAPGGFMRTPGYPQYTFNGVTNGAGILALGANSTTPINGLFAPGPAAGDAFASSVLEAFSADASPLCAPLPTNLSFAGTGTAAVVSYSSTSVSFPSNPGSTGCGNTATPITVVVSNTGNQDFDITGLVLSGADGGAFNAYIGAFNVVTATVPAANNGTPGTAAITIAPKQVPANNNGATYHATLTVPYSIAGEPQPSSQAISIVEESHCP